MMPEIPHPLDAVQTQWRRVYREHLLERVVAIINDELAHAYGPEVLRLIARIQREA